MGKKLMVFWGSWCPVCQRAKEMLSKMNPDWEIELVNVDQNSNKSAEYDARVTPTFIKIKDGKEVGRIMGSQTKSQIKEFMGEVDE